MTVTGTRAQVFTLEGVLAALVVVAGLVFALQAVAVTPSASGGTGQPVDADLLGSVLGETAGSGALDRAVLAWSGGTFLGTASETYYVDAYPPNDFGQALKRAVGPGVAVNVLVHYETASGVEAVRMIYNGAPGDGAVRATTTVTVFDSEGLYSASGSPMPGTSVAGDGLYPNVEDQSGDVYSVLEVEVVAWRA